MKFLIWLVCVIGIEATGIISSLFAGDIAGTYAQMEKPFWPLGGIIGIVWTILYAFMGTALYLLIVAKVNPALKKMPISFCDSASIKLLVEYCFLWLECLLGRNGHYCLVSPISDYLYDPLCSHRQKSNVLVYSLFDLVFIRRLLNDWLNFIECLIEKPSSKRHVGRGFFLLDIVFSQFHKAGNIF